MHVTSALGFSSVSFEDLLLLVCYSSPHAQPAMHLMYTLDESGNRVYTLKVSPRCLRS